MNFVTSLSIFFEFFVRSYDGFLNRLNCLCKFSKDFCIPLCEHLNRRYLGLQHELIVGWIYRWFQNWIQLCNDLFKLPLHHWGFVIITLLMDGKGVERKILKNFLIITKTDIWIVISEMWSGRCTWSHSDAKINTFPCIRYIESNFKCTNCCCWCSGWIYIE